MGRHKSDYAKKASMRYTMKRKADHKAAIMTEIAQLPDALNYAVCWKAYRLDECQCDLHTPPNPRVKNCRHNPYCIHRLGLEKWEKLKSQQRDNSLTQPVHPRDEQPCGLVNFGNFCYVNSFLQLWFNDLVFRQCVYDWRPTPDFVKPEGAKMDVQAVMDSLQRLFLTMQSTPFETASPLELIRLLRLDNEQHDVGEFNTVFFDALDRNLQDHPNGEQFRQLVQNRFESSIRQMIICGDCGHTSTSCAVYRSLQLVIEELKTLTSAIQAFFNPEDLCDYKCGNCGKSGKVTRHSGFSQLPPVLIIQLNRYVFDASGRNKKLKTPIHYPRTLPENLLQCDASSGRTYHLCAVMIHEGQNAHCGHYYDIIKDPVTDQWFTYNDKEVSEAKAPGVDLEKEGSAMKASSDMRGCYALIYRREDADEGMSIENLRLPPGDAVSALRAKLSDEFAKETLEGNRSIKVWNEKISERYAFLRSLWEQLEMDGGREVRKNDIAFLPTSLLSDILLKEYQAIEQMKTLEQLAFESENDNADAARSQNPGLSSSTAEHPPSSSPVAEAKADAKEVDSGTADTSSTPQCDTTSPATGEEQALVVDSTKAYKMEAIEEAIINLCVHDKIALDSVLDGDVKAVTRAKAEEMLDFYGIGLRLQNWKRADGNDWERCDNKYGEAGCRLRTGADICMECVKLKKQEAAFKANLEKTNALITDLGKTMKLRTHYPSNGPKYPELPCPADAFWVSERHLRTFKKLATDQMEHMKHSNRLYWLELKFSPEFDGFRKAVRSSARNAISCSGLFNGVTPPISPKIAQVGSRGSTPSSASDIAVVYDSSFNSSGDLQVQKCQRGPLQLIAKKSRKEPPPAEIADPPAREKHVPSCSQPGGGLASLLVIVDHDADGDGNGTAVEVSNANVDGMDYEEGAEAERQHDTPSSSNGEAAVVEERPTRFNDELLCKHGELNYKVKRVWLRPEEWDTLRAIYTSMSDADGGEFSCAEVPCTQPECAACIQEWREDEARKVTCQSLLDDIYSNVGKMLREIERRREWRSEELGLVYNRLLCPKFVGKFLRAAKSRANSEVPLICQECLLCQHDKPYLVLTANDPKLTAGYPITYAEWRQLVNAFLQQLPNSPRPHEIKLSAQNGVYEEFCHECSDRHLSAEQEKRHIYENEIIYVKLKGDEREEQSAPATSATMTTRRLASRNLMKFKMSSTDRVLDLKLRIYEQLKQSPNDQLLYMGESLLEGEQTLGSAKVEAHNIDNPLTLIVQQTGGPSVESPNGNGETRKLERGFRDTALSTL